MVTQIIIERDALKQKVTAQAAVIEKLRSALDYYANSETDMFKNTARLALTISTDSKQILQDWLDEQLGAPVCITDENHLIRFCVIDDNELLYKKPEILK